MKILAGIVTYCPEIQRLKENIEAILHQVDEVLIVDNASNNVAEIESVIQTYHKMILVKNEENKGIASALNQIMDYAAAGGYQWALTLDQDSVCDSGLIAQYCHYTDIENVGMLTCNFQDRNYDFFNEGDIEEPYVEVTYCITSAALMNVAAFQKSGRFDEQMFIDKVDFDICMTLAEAGYRIIKVNYTGLLQEIGSGTQVNIFGHKIIVYNHSALRRYYMTRNGIYLARKHPTKSLFRAIARELYDIAIVFLFEKEKYKKLRSSCKGLQDGFRLREKRSGNG